MHLAPELAGVIFAVLRASQSTPDKHRADEFTDSAINVDVARPELLRRTAGGPLACQPETAENPLNLLSANTILPLHCDDKNPSPPTTIDEKNSVVLCIIPTLLNTTPLFTVDARMSMPDAFSHREEAMVTQEMFERTISMVAFPWKTTLTTINVAAVASMKSSEDPANTPAFTVICFDTTERVTTMDP